MEIGLGPVYLKLKEILFKGTPSRNHEYYNLNTKEAMVRIFTSIKSEAF